jgi:hypothetical protein
MQRSTPMPSASTHLADRVIKLSLARCRERCRDATGSRLDSTS